MKKYIAFYLAVAIAFGLTSCGKKEKDAVIDYGKSSIYSQADMDAAIELIQNEFATWEGCELHSIRYLSDDCNTEENISWMNDLGDGDTEFTQCILFISDFHSPKKGGGAWNPDSEYTGWQWWLARTGNGNWQLMTWGY